MHPCFGNWKWIYKCSNESPSALQAYWSHYSSKLLWTQTLLVLLLPHCSTKAPKANTPTHASPHPNLFKASPFTPSKVVFISLKCFPTTSSHPILGQPAFCLALDTRLTRMISDNLSSLTCRTCPGHLTVSCNIDPESRIEPHFSFSLLFDKQSVCWAHKTVLKQFLWKNLENPPPFLERPGLRTILDRCHICSFQYSNLVFWLIFLLFQTFYNCEKISLAFVIVLLTSSLQPPSLLIILPR